MSVSRQEEIIAGIWLIAALLAFIAGFNAFGWLLSAKAFADTCGAIYLAVKEIKKQKATGGAA